MNNVERREAAIKSIFTSLSEIPTDIIRSLTTIGENHKLSPISYNPKYPERCDCKDCYFFRLVDNFTTIAWPLLISDETSN